MFFGVSARSTGYTAVPSLANMGVLRADSALAGMVLATGGADPIIFQIEDAEKVRISTSGNVGIGEVAPGAKLSVSGGMAVGSSYDTTAVSDGNLIISGNVGIGTTGPGAKLDVEGNMVLSNNPYNHILIDDFDDDVYIKFVKAGDYSKVAGQIMFDGYSAATTVSSLIKFSTGDGTTLQDRMIIRGDGNVGIGTTGPGAKLEVNGDVKVSGGEVYMGYEMNYNTAWASGSNQINCSKGKKVIGGGCSMSGDGTLRDSYPFDSGTETYKWKCECDTSHNIKAYVMCAEINN